MKHVGKAVSLSFRLVVLAVSLVVVLVENQIGRRQATPFSPDCHLVVVRVAWAGDHHEQTIAAVLIGPLVLLSLFARLVVLFVGPIEFDRRVPVARFLLYSPIYRIF